MKQVSLDRVALHHFRSFIEPMVFVFPADAGLKALFGDNQVEERLGGNGAGKSSVWDGVSFVLYGTSVKGLRATDLVSYGHDTLAATLALRVDNEPHEILRTAPPMRISLDGKPAEQADIDRLVGLTKPRFLASVIFGQAAPLFIDLPVPQRGDLLDEMLGLELWMKAAELAGRRHREGSEKLAGLRTHMARTEGQMTALGDFERYTELIENWNLQKRQRLTAVLAEFETAEHEHEALDLEYGKGLHLVDEEESRTRRETFQQQNLTAHARWTAANTEVKRLYDDSQFLMRNEICPVCHQPINEQHAHDYSERSRTRLIELDEQRETARLDIETTAAEAAAADLTWRGAVRENQERVLQHHELMADMQVLERQLQCLERQAEAINAEVNPYEAEAERAVAEYRRLEATFLELKAEEEQLVSDLSALDFWRQGFRRVRLYCLEQVLRELTIETHNSLLSLGLPGWHIGFTTTTETKAGTQRLGVQVDLGGARKFEMVSGGEGQRARLAASLGFAGLVQRWAGVRWDIEVWDEPTAWLSDAGVNDLLDCLAARAESLGKSIWVCDHRALSHGAFRVCLTVVKDAAGSRLAA